ncbi:recombinase family protein [bacterium AH-315-J21]|nr:recombinase family protein [bacterium AH-315-J21]
MARRTNENTLCAVYTRYSSDLQSVTSIDDQERNCRKFAHGRGWSIVEGHIYADRAISGTTIVGRPGLDKLIVATEGKRHQFDYVLVDDTSRLSRDTVEQATLIRDFKDSGVNVYFVSDGIDTKDETTQDVLLPVYGIKDALYSRDLARKTQRGMAGQVLRGYSAGGRLYGYEYTQELDPNGTIDKKTRQVRSLGSRITIDEEQARVVRMIFEMYANGHGLKAIAMSLNEKNIIPPRKAVQSRRRETTPTWGPFTIRAMLHNHRYSGDWTWNKKKWFRKRKTGKRIYRDRPETDWVKVSRPELAVVDDSTWSHVQSRIKTNLELYAKGVRVPRRDYLLSGLLECDVCGANLTIVRSSDPEKAKYACSFNWRRGAKACTNNVLISRVEIEARVIEAINERVLHPKSIHRIVELVNERLKRVIPKAQEERDILTNKSKSIESELTNLIQFVAQSGDRSSHIASAISDKEAQLALVQTQIESWSEQASCKELKIDTNYALSWMNKLSELMKCDVVRARTGIAQLVGTLKAKPVTHNGMTGLLLVGRPQLDGILGIVGASSTSNGSGGRI